MFTRDCSSNCLQFRSVKKPSEAVSNNASYNTVSGPFEISGDLFCKASNY